jgi:hypothetical protein
LIIFLLPQIAQIFTDVVCINVQIATFEKIAYCIYQCKSMQSVAKSP